MLETDVGPGKCDGGWIGWQVRDRRQYTVGIMDIRGRRVMWRAKEARGRECKSCRGGAGSEQGPGFETCRERRGCVSVPLGSDPLSDLNVSG